MVMILYGSVMPSADIRDLEMHPTTSIMCIGTQGRGAYQITCPNLDSLAKKCLLLHQTQNVINYSTNYCHN
jgi:hypothetical protein